VWASLALGDAAQEGVVLFLVGLYFWLVFGHLSRRFERQADVFGSKIVSCEAANCPPHTDLDSEPMSAPGKSSRLPLCRRGLRTFSEALAIVAQCNGMEFGRRSWRHGSIASRIRFLEHLEDDPDRERSFQREVVWLRGVLGVVLLLALMATAVLQLSGR
jgi:STE24 endopeptidase